MFRTKHRLKHFGVICLLLFLTLGALKAQAHEPTHYTTAHATTHTDAWVRAKVLSFESFIQEGFEHRCGRFHTGLVTLDIIDSTDPAFLGQIELDIRLESARDMQPGQEIFLALKEYNTRYLLKSPKGLYSWLCYVESEYLGDYRSAENADITWSFLKDFRIAVDQDGVILEESLQYWKNILYSEDGTSTQLMAWEIVNYVEGIDIDIVPIAESLTHQMVQLESMKEKNDEQLDAALVIFIELYLGAMESITQSGNAEASAILSRLYIDNKSIHRVLWGGYMKLNERNLTGAMVELMLASTDQASVDAFAGILGDVIELDSDVLYALDKKNEATIDALLWDIILNPKDYNVEGFYELGRAWKILGKHGDPKLKSYLETEILSPDDPPNEYITEHAYKALEELAQSTLSREAYLLNRVNAMLAGHYVDISAFRDALSPEDTHLAKRLARVHSNKYPNTFSYDFILTIPDPVFVPTLRKRLSKNSVSSTHLKALYACGDKEFLFAHIEKLLDIPLEADNPSDYEMNLRDRIDLLITLGSFDDPRAKTLLLPYYDMTRFDQYVQDLLEVNNDQGRTDYFEKNYRNKLLIALTRYGGEHTLSALHHTYNDPNTKTKLTAALCLYTLDDPVGRELVDAFREQRIPESSEDQEGSYYWHFKLGIIHDVIIEMMMPPKIEALFAERLEKGIDEADLSLLRITDFMRNAGSPLLKNMLPYLDNPNPKIQNNIFNAYQRVLYKEPIQYNTVIEDEIIYNALGNEIIAQCKEDILIYIKSLEAKESAELLANTQSP